MTLAFLVASGELSSEAAGPHEIACSQCYGSVSGCSHCDGKARRKGHVVLRGVPKEILGNDEWEAVLAWNVARAGFLPEAGGFTDQTEWFQQIFLHLQSCAGMLEQQRSEEMKRKMKSGQGGAAKAPPRRAATRATRGGFV